VIWDGLTGDAFLTESARGMLLCQKTPALFTCGEPRCAYSVVSWQAELPSITWNTARSWPKCPEKHRAKFVASLVPLEEMAS
jgi:hypothetical protein